MVVRHMSRKLERMQNLNFKKLSLIIVLVIWTAMVFAQAGMYTESDVEYQTLFIEAQEAKYKGDTDKQEKILKEVIKRNKGAHAAYYELAQMYFLERDNEKALSNAKKAHNLDIQNEWYLLLLAEINESSLQISDASACYSKLKSISPNNPAVYHKLAQLLLTDSKPDQAIAELEELQHNLGIEEETSRRLFDIYKAQGDTKGAIKTLNALCQSNPDNTRLLANKASYLKEIGQSKKALAVYKEILEIDPLHNRATLAVNKSKTTQDGDKKSRLTAIIENKNITLDDKIKEMMPLVSRINKKNNNNDLAAIADNLVEQYPDNAKVYALRGDINFYLSDYNAASSDYQKAINIDDSKYSLWSQYMQTLWELEDYKTMEKISYDAVDYFPNKVEAFISHAVALHKSKQSGAEGLLAEAGFIAGNNTLLKNKLTIVSEWLKGTHADINKLPQVDDKDLYLPLMPELIGDIYSSSNSSKNANKYWDLSIHLGANPKRIEKKRIIE